MAHPTGRFGNFNYSKQSSKVGKQSSKVGKQSSKVGKHLVCSLLILANC